MEDGIPGWLYYCHEVCCKKGGHHGRQACIVDNKYTIEICFPDKWTWHMTTTYITHINLKENTLLFRVGQWKCSTNQ